MALNKKIVNDRGVETNYHRIAHVTIDGNIMSCSVESYVSPEYRELNKPADFYNYQFDITIEEEESMGIRALCYKKIKEMDAWLLSIDC
jgi:hypothetical protein